MTWQRFWWSDLRRLGWAALASGIIVHQAAGWQGFPFVILAQVGLLFVTLRPPDQLQHGVVRIAALLGPSFWLEFTAAYPNSSGYAIWLSFYDPTGMIVAARWVLLLWVSAEVLLFLLDVAMAGWPERVGGRDG